MSICTASTIRMHTRVTASSVLILVPHSNRCSFPLVSGCVKSDGDSSDSGGWSEEEGSEEDNVSTLHSADTNVQCPYINYPLCVAWFMSAHSSCAGPCRHRPSLS